LSTPQNEALGIIKDVLNDIKLFQTPYATRNLRQCYRIARLLQLDDIDWINKELKGYPDDNIPSYRVIETECRYSWRGDLPNFIKSYRARRNS